MGQPNPWTTLLPSAARNGLTNHRGLLLALPGSLTAIVHASFTLVTVASTTHSNIYTMLAIVAVRRKEKLEWKAVTRGHTDRKLSPMKIDLQIMASR